LWVILAVGGFFRIYGFRHGYPFSFHIDEWYILRDSLEMYRQHSLRPPTFDYPSFLYYYNAALAAGIAFFHPATLSALHLASRISSAFWGIASIAAIYRMTQRVGGRTAGYLAAALFACTVTALREAHFATIDTMNTFFIILAMDAIVRISGNEDKRNYILAGIFVGLAAGTKYNGILLLAPLLLAHLMHEMHSPVSLTSFTQFISLLRSRLFHKYLFLAAGIAATVFIFTTPFAVADALHFSKLLAGKLLHMSSGIAPWNHHYINTTPYLYYFENLLYWGMGPVLEMAGICGAGYLLLRHHKEDVVILIWIAVYFALVGAWFNKASRYVLPMLPFLSLAIAVLFVEMKTRCEQNGRRLYAWGSAFLAAIVLFSSLLYSLAFLRIYSRPHTGIQTLQWALENLPQGSTVLLEPTAWERPPIDGGVPLSSGTLAVAGPNRFHIKELDVLKFADGQMSQSELEALLRRTLEDVDYIVISMRWYEGFVNSPVVSPVLRNYYRNLLGGTGAFQRIREINSYPGLLGTEWNDDGAELNFRIFDHPKVLIFQRRKIWDAKSNTMNDPVGFGSAL
jgi:4-amino-4-deoxy-L-arabinose transferase-like glycosyltransferase